MRLKTLWILLLLALASGNALAGGQAACRVEVPFQAVCFAEQNLLTLGSFELTAGAELRLPDPTLVPFVAAGWYEQDWWSVLEVRAPFLLRDLTPDRGFTAALSIGIRWP